MIVSHHTARNYMKSKKTNKKFDFKVFTETGPKIKSDYGWYTTKFKIDDNDLKNKGGKPTVRVSNVGHALHAWLNGEYHGRVALILLSVCQRETETLVSVGGHGAVVTLMDPSKNVTER
ncbi:hypothetical protein DY000_02054896 [Brassica cretica]|uniref:Beta-galactosidase galactose-binding domain-containing protein n=1 Tax=Brassica cretica TaxID=69181 RepID=A0ABQ7A6B0_BRACR|nr:hypothetical protein DY000_02054896 [Brassica cretica]